MNISDKDRKLLWAKSGNRCAICKEKLFQPNENGTDINRGEECHIISKTPNGPRYMPNMQNYDTYDNLILLCNLHHKEIDDDNNISLYPPQRLHQIKKEHEKWVNKSLELKKEPKEKDWNSILKKLNLINPY
ncbi:MAG: hypothetical protein K6G92_00835 [Bacteroidaceae bacterium]|nr:hypothetical protein [Bacteroidaceae bacterium]